MKNNTAQYISLGFLLLLAIGGFVPIKAEHRFETSSNTDKLLIPSSDKEAILNETALPLFSDDSSIEETIARNSNSQQKTFFTEENLSEDIPLLKGSAHKALSANEKVQISLNTLISSEFSNFGDPVQAKVLISQHTKDPSLIALRGALLKGNISDIKRSRKAGRNGRINIHFTSIKLSTGTELPIDAEMSTESFRGKELLNTLAEDTKLIGRGVLWGTFQSFRIAPVYAFTTEGATLALGAGVGATMGLIGALRRSGESKTISYSNNSIITFKDNLIIPEEELFKANLNQTRIKNNNLIGLQLNLEDMQMQKSEDFEQLLSLKLKINNQTDSTIYPSDLILIPLNGDDPIVPDLRLSKEALLNQIREGEESEITIYYPLENNSNLANYKLALIDPISKEHLSEIKLIKKQKG